MKQKGILLINLGTPDQCDGASVRRYLREFLNDPRVVDLPWYVRWPLVNLLIVPFRHKKTTQAYKKIWTEAGSPLLTHTQNLCTAVSKQLGDSYRVAYGMRYGKPSIATALKQVDECDSIIVLPLFPQYSSAANGSAIENFYRVLSSKWNMPSVHVINDFYNHSGFIAACADIIRTHCAESKPDLVLFSYHGLPERHIDKSDCKAACGHSNACPVMVEQNRFCYRAQCYATTNLIAVKLGMQDNEYSVSFQSRLGRTPWIKPYTDIVLQELIQKGVKHLAIVCPSFVSDCLETLEEINIRAREQWVSLGGTEFTYIPCVNETPLWVEAVAGMVRGFG